MRGIHRSICGAVLALVLLAGCTAQSSLVPLERGRVTGTVSFGGPIVEAFGTHIPVPWLAAGADVGLGRRVNATGVVHLLPLAYRVAGLDAGATWFPSVSERVDMGLGGRIFAFGSWRNGADERTLVYPVVTWTVARAIGSRRPFVGADLTFPLKQPAFDDEAAPVLVSPFAGMRWPLSDRLFLVTQVKWHAANVHTDRMVTGYTGLGRRGALTPLVALQRRF